MKNRIICLCILLTLIFSSSAYSQELLIFGGSGHDKFLGCFNCNPYEGDSICNKYGEYSTSMGSMEAAIRQKVFGMNIHHQNPFLY